MQSGYLVIVETKPPELYKEVKREVPSEISTEEDNLQAEGKWKRISEPSVLIEFEQ